MCREAGAEPKTSIYGSPEFSTWLLQCLYTKSNHIFFKESKPTSFIQLLSLKFSLVICGSLLMFSYCLIQSTCPDFQGAEWVRHSKNEVTGLCSRLSPQPGSGTAHTHPSFSLLSVCIEDLMCDGFPSFTWLLLDLVGILQNSSFRK